MNLTQYFSRVKADGGFLHNEGMNLPLQWDKSTLKNKSYSREEVHKLFTENNMADPVTYQGDQYFFTGKVGKSLKEPQTLAFEYSDYGEEMEQRIWVNTKGEVTPD
jgi:hypothetical protein